MLKAVPLVLTAHAGQGKHAQDTQLARVKSFWQSVSQQERMELLSISLDDLDAKLLDLTDNGKPSELLACFLYAAGIQFTY